MSKRLALTSSLLAVGLVAAGCGGGNGGGGGGKAKTPSKPAAPAAGGKTVQVSMKNIQFSPKSITVNKGTTVKWTNDEGVNHDVTKESGPGADFKSGSPGNMSQGDSFSHKFTAAGTYKYVCTIHKPGMAGTITVK